MSQRPSNQSAISVSPTMRTNSFPFHMVLAGEDSCVSPSSFLTPPDNIPVKTICRRELSPSILAPGTRSPSILALGTIDLYSKKTATGKSVLRSDEVGIYAARYAMVRPLSRWGVMECPSQIGRRSLLFFIISFLSAIKEHDMLRLGFHLESLASADSNLPRHWVHPVLSPGMNSWIKPVESLYICCISGQLGLLGC